MKVGLIDIDSKIPNLVLMKLSAYYKKIFKYEVELTGPLFIENYDMIFASKVFTYSYMPILPEWINLGGSGVDLKSKLKDQIEHMMPDYSLYPKIDYSLGFTTRGCHRKCPFCIVPEKEGNVRFNADIHEFWNPDFKKIVLLDNNIFALNGQFERIAEQLLRENLRIDFNQGLDIRLLDDNKAEILKKLKAMKQWRFAFDSIKQEKSFRRGAEILINNNISKSLICIYVLAGFDEDFETTLKRVKIIYEEYGFDPFVMIYQDFSDTKSENREFKELKTVLNVPSWKKWNNFARWVNKKEIFKSVSWENYDP
ncbi:MAG: hypothetical protein KAT69_10650 [Candidatus Aminicenantes bacterium]|nr:hypothetical protein [Candidatus Aminicenantes bacterium]